MKPFRLLILSVCLLFAITAAAAQKSLPAPPPGAKCAVCGMFVGKYANWIAAIAYNDGAKFYFDGPKDMFTFYLNPGKYGAGKRAEIADVYVKDYYSLASIDAKQAFYVIGSDVLGPMGKELVPFARRADADGFLHDHKGKKVVRFDDVTPALLKTME